MLQFIANTIIALLAVLVILMLIAKNPIAFLIALCVILYSLAVLWKQVCKGVNRLVEMCLPKRKSV